MAVNKPNAFLDIESKDDLAFYLERPVKDLTMLAYSQNGARYKTFEIGKNTPAKNGSSKHQSDILKQYSVS